MKVLLVILIIGLAFWHLKRERILFSEISWGQRIYTSLIYLLSLFLIFLGGSKLLKVIRAFELNVLIETFVFLIVFAIGLWFIGTIWTMILPKKVLEHFSKQ
ncbi:hypothetical protein CSE16_07985 [Solibacillus sp. R5-41]|uniref:hypothetical protein n=1 Tax=Solibacillus sp. R5-41 TaxID=2048654 RepID=UPI000C1292EA|nr:hypothetical protein [Solibacillus sp. R5-41]ATP39993.1 hypothetical protein CSE16_07985 [Solibacillus sp. R5-41]